MPQNITEVTGVSDLQVAIDGAGQDDILMLSDTHVGDYTITDKSLAIVGRENSRIQGKVSMLGTCSNVHLLNLDFQLNGSPATTNEPAVSMQRAIDCSIRGCRFRGHAYTAGIQFDPLFTAERCLLAANDIDGMDNFGMILYGNNHRVVGNNIGNLAKTVANATAVACMRIWGTGHVIERNYLHDLFDASSLGTTHAGKAIESFTSIGAGAVPWPLNDVTIAWNNFQRIDHEGIHIDNNSATPWASNIRVQANLMETQDEDTVMRVLGVAGANVMGNLMVHRGAGAVQGILLDTGTGGPVATNPVVQANRYFYDGGAGTVATLGGTVFNPTVTPSNVSYPIATFDPAQFVNPRFRGAGAITPDRYVPATV